MISKVKKNKKKLYKLVENKFYIPIICLLLFFCIIGSFYFFIQTHQVFAANFADDFLRPRIGNQATIAIEAFFFQLQDNANQVKYAFIKPDSQIFANPKVAQNTTTVINTEENFTLTPIPPLTGFSLIPGEGNWISINSGTSNTIMAKTFIRPDPQRSYAIVSLVKMDMSKLAVAAVAGYREPGGPQNRGPGIIPKAMQNSNMLLAAFNGGFQRKDGAYGMIVGGVTYLPLKENLATFVIYQNDKPKIVNFTGQNLGNDIFAIRQNGPLLLENGEIITASESWNMQTWGLTTTNSMYTWRSGIGITKNGNLLYAAGPSLIPETLAAALKAAGAVNAMQLDINPVWVRFVTFTPTGNGSYATYPLAQGMVNGGYEYLHGYQKDFFYVYKKS